MNILVVEDDASSRMILSGLLKKWDFNPFTIEDGKKAWKIIQQGKTPTLMLIDWDMPGMDGITLCKKIKEQEEIPPVYIILVTGRCEKKDIVEGLDAGADDYITKPFDKNEFHARLNVAKRMILVQRKLATKIEELKQAMEHVKQLQGIIPICMYCHKIRNDNEAWDKLETYMAKHSDAELSHSICPDCMGKKHPDGDDS